ncbi:MAG: chemotaxis protein CheD, partial [Rhodoferax sp.]|nr:chemotaxis protein CheD [Rhodoferax sp.]
MQDLIDIFLQPGELFVGDKEYQIRTILGSCVSITLWHAHLRMGGMSHFLLPTRSAGTGDFEPDGRYGDEALQLMLDELKKYGVRAEDCEAKIFGGGNMFPGHGRSSAMLVGQRNGEAARNMLQARGIPVVSESLFGIGHRQIIFDVSNGDVWSRQIEPSQPSRKEDA